MQGNEKGKSNPRKNLNLHSNFWSFSILAGVFFGMGYIITKNIYLSKIPNKLNLNQFQARKDFSSPKSPFSQRNSSKIKVANKHLPVRDKTIKKIIYLPSYENSIIKLEINYSQIQNIKNQEFFKNNQNFFANETVKSLIKTLKNTKKTKSYRVRAD